MKKSLLFSALLILSLSVAAYALHHKRRNDYGDIQGAKYIRNYDGDTITMDIPGYPAIIGDNISIRVNGIDTPEIRGKCENEKRLAKRAKYQVGSIMANAGHIELKNIRRGKYFRIVADVWVDNQPISQILVAKKLAVPYKGGKKVKDWCN